MKNEKPKSFAREAAAKLPFQLIVHIGNGKTGTSSIQETLRLSQDKLRQRGIVYLGLNLEHVPDKKYEWQRASGSEKFHALDAEVATAQLFEILHSAVNFVKSLGISRAIWSNEWLFARGKAAVPALSALAADGVEVKILAYVRRHDAWARSSYIQWGLKHKTY